jgi:NADPH-dependent curcumin reductase CurA
MDSLALQKVPNPEGKYPLSFYTNIMGTPGLTAFVGFEAIIDGKQVSSNVVIILVCSKNKMIL